MAMKTTSWSDIDSNNNNRQKSKRVSDLVEVYDKKNYSNKWQAIRLVGPITSNCMHTVKCQGKDPTKPILFFSDCLNYNRETGDFEDNNCPYCQVGVPKSIKFYQNAIIRELENNPPANKGERTPFEKEVRELGDNKFYVKENKETSSWTPVRMVELPKSLAGKLHNIEVLNFYKDPETGERHSASPSDLRYGVDLFITYKPDSNDPKEKYDIQRDADSGKTPITKEMRKEYLFWDLELPEIDEKLVRENFKRNALKLLNADNKEELAKVQASLQADTPKTSTPKPIKTVDLDDDLDDITPAQSAMSEDVEIKAPKASVSTMDMDEFEDL